MNRPKTVDELVATLTEKEKERHKDLIEECRKREVELNKIADEHRQMQEKLGRSIGELRRKFNDLTEGFERLKNAADNLRRKTQEDFLLALPAEKLPRA